MAESFERGFWYIFLVQVQLKSIKMRKYFWFSICNQHFFQAHPSEKMLTIFSNWKKQTTQKTCPKQKATKTFPSFPKKKTKHLPVWGSNWKKLRTWWPTVLRAINHIHEHLCRTCCLMWWLQGLTFYGKVMEVGVRWKGEGEIGTDGGFWFYFDLFFFDFDVESTRFIFFNFDFDLDFEFYWIGLIVLVGMIILWRTNLSISRRINNYL